MALKFTVKPPKFVPKPKLWKCPTCRKWVADPMGIRCGECLKTNPIPPSDYPPDEDLTNA